MSLEGRKLIFGSQGIIIKQDMSKKPVNHTFIFHLNEWLLLIYFIQFFFLTCMFNIFKNLCADISYTTPWPYNLFW